MVEPDVGASSFQYDRSGAPTSPDGTTVSQTSATVPSSMASQKSDH